MIVRPFNTLGPRQSLRAIVPTIVTQVLTRGVVQLGSLDPTRDLNYVSDTVRGFLRAASAPAAVGGVFNLGRGEEISIGDLARLVTQILGTDVPIQVDPQRLRPAASEVHRLCADSSAASEMLDWRPHHTFAEGLELTIDWLRQNHSELGSAKEYVV